MSQLYVRPALDDHHVIAEMLAPSPIPTIRRLRPPIGRLVIDAHHAPQRPTFARSATDAGIPLLVDPLTPLLQSELDPTNKWLDLPFAAAAAVPVDRIDVGGLVESVVQFQIEQGATHIIAPYLVARDPADPAFTTSLALLAHTVTYLHDEGMQLPVTAIMCAQLQTFARPAALAPGVGRFARAAADYGVETLALCLTPLGAGTDSYAKLSGMVTVATTAMRAGIDVIAWRQGVYGPALCAAGLDGYETGVCASEQTNIASYQNSRKPRRDQSRGGGGNGAVYFEPLGHSLPSKASKALLGDIGMRAKLICDDENCCADNSAMLDARREHAVRSRARTLAELNQQPHRQWRLHTIATHAKGAATLARQANKVLAAANDVNHQIKTKNLDALAQIGAELAYAAADDRPA